MVFMPALCRVPMVIVGIFALTACEAAFKGEPRVQLSDTRPALRDTVINSTLGSTNVANAISRPTQGNRNAIVLARIAEIDALYYEYETALLVESRKTGFAGSFSGALVGLLGAQTSSISASQNYSLLGGTINALQTSYQKEVLAERTINALIAQMRANRANAREDIYRKLTSTTSQYPLQAAISDLETYRQAGTLATALTGITEQATQQAEIAENSAQRTVEEFSGVTGVQRSNAGAALTQQTLTVPFQERVTTLTTAVRAGEVDPEKVVTLLKNPQITDGVARQRVLDIALIIKGATQQDDFGPEALNATFLGALGDVIAGLDQASFEEVETALN